MIHGIINVYKEKGYTSHDVVAKLRGITGQRKIGHTGTLDPDAEGVLPVCLGRGTKVCDLLTDKDKVYEAVLLLGKSTDTQDITGVTISEADTSMLKPEEVEHVIESFEGSYDQIPPMYSALKVNGKKLYELAREGKTIERKARTVFIHEIRIKKMELPRVILTVKCSKGTYIRTLCQDIGEKLGVGGCMESLLRTCVDRFCLEESKTLEEIQCLKEQGRLEEIVLPVDEVFSGYRRLAVLKDQERLLYNGNPFSIEEQEVPFDNELVRVYDCEERFVAVYKYDKKRKQYGIVKMFFNQQDTEG